MNNNIKIYIVTKYDKFLDTKIGGYIINLTFGKRILEYAMSVEGVSKNPKVDSLKFALDKLKNNKYELSIITDFLSSKEDLEELTSKKANSALKNSLVNYVVDSVELISEEKSILLSKKLDEEIEKKKIDYKIKYDILQGINELKDSVILEKVNRKAEPLKSVVKVDSFTDIAKKAFDFEFTGESTFYPFEKPTMIPKDFNIGVIVGASGTGKTTLLKEFGEYENFIWDNELSIVSQFESPEDAIDKLSAVGLNSIPSWVKPYEVLSVGEKFRADLSQCIKDNAVIDEFTSVVDRNVAKATSTAFSKYVKRNDIKGIVISTCHEDILEWLEPDWIFNTNEGVLYSGEHLRRPKIKLEIYETKDYDLWKTFKNHHYLSEDLNKASRKFIAVWENQIVGFNATLPLPSGTLKNAWRGHRTVILPDFQGLGIGVRFSDAIGEIHIAEGKRYFSKTSHIRMGTYRESSSLWKPTSKNRKQRKDMEYVYGNRSWKVDQDKVSFSHEYIGKTIDN